MDPSPPRRLSTWHCLAVLAALRIGLHLVLAHRGLVALSDDDYARAVIAERFAAHPAIDPSGTSWLPLPFFITGGAMALFGSSLGVARAVAEVLSVGALWLVFAGLRRLRVGQGAALVGAVIAAIVPPSAVLGSVAVPEFSTAALCAFALLSITRPHLRAMVAESPDWETGLWLAAAAIAAATLCRYEAWPIAVVIAAFAWIRRVPIRARIGSSALALAGPLAWMLNGRIAHGDALHFLQRVSSYKAAVGGASGAAQAASYAGALVTGCPSLVVPLVAVAIAAYRVKPTALLRWAPALAGVGALVLFLVAGAIVGGAPTHHPERALLLFWIVGAAMIADLGRHLVARAPSPAQRRALRLGEIVVVAFLALDTERQLDRAGIDRRAEESVGQALAALAAPGERALVATDDYGYFAVIAAFGRPNDAAIDRTHDPREAPAQSALASAETLGERIAKERAAFVVAPASALLPAATMKREASAGRLAVYRVP